MNSRKIVGFRGGRLWQVGAIVGAMIVLCLAARGFALALIGAARPRGRMTSRGQARATASVLIPVHQITLERWAMRRVVEGLLLTAALLGLISFFHPLSAQTPGFVVLCAPCSGKDFNVPSDRGMAVMASDGDIWFYPLNQAPPIRIGRLARVGAPIAWDSGKGVAPH